MRLFMIEKASGIEHEIVAFDKEKGTVTFRSKYWPDDPAENITVDWPTDPETQAKRKENYRMEQRPDDAPLAR